MSDNKPPGKMSNKDMTVKIMDLITQEGVSKKTLSKILAYVERMLSEPDEGLQAQY